MVAPLPRAILAISACLWSALVPVASDSPIDQGWIDADGALRRDDECSNDECSLEMLQLATEAKIEKKHLADILDGHPQHASPLQTWLFSVQDPCSVRPERSRFYIALCLGALLACSCVLQLNGDQLGLGPIGHSLVSMVCFGVTLFLNGFANKLFPQAHVYVCVLNCLQGILGLAGHVRFSRSDDGKQQYHENFDKAMTFSMGSQLVMFFLPGLTCVTANYGVQNAFGSDPCDSGVDGAVVTMDPVLETIFFWFYMRERPSNVQFLGIFMAVSGAAGLSSGGGEANSKAMAWCMSAMLSLAVNVITCRLSSLAGIGSEVPWVLQQASQGIAGFFLFLVHWAIDGEITAFSPSLLLWPAMGCCAQAIGHYSVILSFRSPEAITGVNGAIIGSCAVVNFFLDWFLFGHRPPFAKLLCMAVILIGIIALSLDPGGDSLPDGGLEAEVEPSEGSATSPTPSVGRSKSMPLTQTPKWWHEEDEDNDHIWNWKSTIAYWCSVLSIEGTLLFIVCTGSSLLNVAKGNVDLERAWLDYTFLIGSVCFLVSSYLSYFQVINKSHRHGKDADAEAFKFIVFPRQDIDLGHIGSLACLIGSISFMIPATALFGVDMSSKQTYNLLYAVPCMVGVCGFLTAAICKGEYNGWREDRPLREWELPVWQAFLILVGASSFFMGQALGIIHFNLSHPLLGFYLGKIPAFFGCSCILVVSWLDLMMWKSCHFGLGYAKELRSGKGGHHLTLLGTVDWKQQLMMIVYCGNICIACCNMGLHLAVPALRAHAVFRLLGIFRELGIYVTIIALANVVHKTPQQFPYGLLLWMMRVVALYDFSTQICYMVQLASQGYAQEP